MKIESFIFNEDKQQYLPRKEKANGLLRSLPIPQRLELKQEIPTRLKISECLHIFRPLFYCLLLSVHEQQSLRPMICSIAIDAAILLLRLNYKRSSLPESEELRTRNRELWYVYLFRRPFYTQVFRPKILEPAVKKLIRWETISNLILQSIDFRTSYSLTM